MLVLFIRTPNARPISAPKPHTAFLRCAAHEARPPECEDLVPARSRLPDLRCGSRAGRCPNRSSRGRRSGSCSSSGSGAWHGRHSVLVYCFDSAMKFSPSHACAWGESRHWRAMARWQSAQTRGAWVCGPVPTVRHAASVPQIASRATAARAPG